MIAGDAVRMSLSLAIDCADLNALAQGRAWWLPVGSVTAKGRSRRRGGRPVTARIFKREEDRLGEQISRANSGTMILSA
jgi:hypothetical protein